jgi:hypothetical protein
MVAFRVTAAPTLHPRSPPTRCVGQSVGGISFAPLSRHVQPKTDSPRRAPGRILVDDFLLLHGRQTPSFSPSPVPKSVAECPLASKPGSLSSPGLGSPPARAHGHHAWAAMLGGA